MGFTAVISHSVPVCSRAAMQPSSRAGGRPRDNEGGRCLVLGALVLAGGCWSWVGLAGGVGLCAGCLARNLLFPSPCQKENREKAKKVADSLLLQEKGAAQGTAAQRRSECRRRSDRRAWTGQADCQRHRICLPCTSSIVLPPSQSYHSVLLYMAYRVGWSIHVGGKGIPLKKVTRLAARDRLPGLLLLLLLLYLLCTYHLHSMHAACIHPVLQMPPPFLFFN